MRSSFVPHSDTKGELTGVRSPLGLADGRADLERLPRGGDPLRLAASGSSRARARPACRLSSRRRSPTTPPPTTPGRARWGRRARPFWRDHMGAGVNAIRTQTLIRAADVVVVRFGDKYRQWNAAFDAGFAAALGKPIDHPARPRARPRAEGGRPRRPGDGAHRRAGGRRAPLRDHRQVALEPLGPSGYGGRVTADANRELIERFYEAFGRCNGAAMTACYRPTLTSATRPSATFEGAEVGAMWRMLTGRAIDLEDRAARARRRRGVRLRPLDRPLHVLDRPPGGKRHPGRSSASPTA